MANIDIQVPDIGDFDEVTVIELMVKVGDSVKPDQSLITVESDKASMEIPSSHGGVVKELKVKLGDKVKQGTLVLVLEGEGGAAAPAPASAPAAAPAAPVASPAASAAPAAPAIPAPTASSFGGNVDLECDVLVLGGGPGGYSAAFRAADLGLKVVIVERYATLGGVCLNVGCIPSKALLNNSHYYHLAQHEFASRGIKVDSVSLDLPVMLQAKDSVVSKLTSGIEMLFKKNKVQYIKGFGRFKSPNDIAVDLADGSQTTVSAKHVIIATGSEPTPFPIAPVRPRLARHFRRMSERVTESCHACLPPSAVRKLTG